MMTVDEGGWISTKTFLRRSNVCVSNITFSHYTFIRIWDVLIMKTKAMTIFLINVRTRVKEHTQQLGHNNTMIRERASPTVISVGRDIPARWRNLKIFDCWWTENIMWKTFSSPQTLPHRWATVCGLCDFTTAKEAGDERATKMKLLREKSKLFYIIK